MTVLGCMKAFFSGDRNVEANSYFHHWSCWWIACKWLLGIWFLHVKKTKLAGSAQHGSWQLIDGTTRAGLFLYDLVEWALSAVVLLLTGCEWSFVCVMVLVWRACHLCEFHFTDTLQMQKYTDEILWTSLFYIRYQIGPHLLSVLSFCSFCFVLLFTS